MSSLARADLESLLRARKLDGTLRVPDRAPDEARAPSGLAPLDRVLGGGLPRGQLSSLAGARSGGGTSLVCALLAAATARGEMAALIDPFDTFDSETGAAAGLDLSRLFWIRGHQPAAGGAVRTDLVFRLVDRAVKALGLVLHAGGFGLVVLDLADVPARAIRQLPFTTWLRAGRAIEGSRTAGLVVAPAPVARSPGGLTITLQPAAAGGRWSGAGPGRMLRGLEICVRVVSHRGTEMTQQIEIGHRDTDPCSPASSSLPAIPIRPMFQPR